MKLVYDDGSILALGEAEAAALLSPETYARALAARSAPLAALCVQRGVALRENALDLVDVGDAETLALMVERGAKVARETLLRAAARGASNLIRLLLVKYDFSRAIEHAAFEAAAGGHADTLRILLDSISGGQGYGDALTAALRHSRADCARLLITRGADIDLSNIGAVIRLFDDEFIENVAKVSKHEALESAARVNRPRAARALLDRGVRATYSALYQAIHADAGAIVTMLLDAGAPITTCERDALDIAAEHGRANAARALLAHPAAAKCDRALALSFAANSDHAEIVEMLMPLVDDEARGEALAGAMGCRAVQSARLLLAGPLPDGARRAAVDAGAKTQSMLLDEGEPADEELAALLSEIDK